MSISLTRRRPFVLLDDNLSPDGRSHLFENPVSVIRCDEPHAVPGALRELSAATGNGLYAAGFLSYELGYLLEPRLADKLPAERRQPLIWMGLFERAEAIEGEGVATLLGEEADADCAVRDLSLSMGEADYRQAFDRVKEYIAAGDIYQVNLTLKYWFAFDGDPLALYARLRRRQRVAYG
ncbi:MAG: chorismate-binding protein, partial [Alphaproteobacteria bacterium]|nr:chorismate-binding protein [Alphaproteobacteria bacterium]